MIIALIMVAAWATVRFAMSIAMAAKKREYTVSKNDATRTYSGPAGKVNRLAVNL